jgi:putative membrane protein
LRSLTPPTRLDTKHRELVDRLSKLNGAEFDREYMNAMVPGHEDVAAKLRTMGGETLTSTSTTRGTESVGTSGSNAALRQWASKTLPTVQQHLAHSEEVQQKVR